MSIIITKVKVVDGMSYYVSWFVNKEYRAAIFNSREKAMKIINQWMEDDMNAVPNADGKGDEI